MPAKPSNSATQRAQVLTAKQRERQARHERLLGYGAPGVQRAASGSVAVIGAGGLGCPALQVLAAAGVGSLRIIDTDVVERSNLARQTLFRESDIGRRKVDAARDALVSFAPEASIEPVHVQLAPANARALIEDADVVLDTTDHWPTRFAVADACRDAAVPLVWGSVLSWDGLLTVFAPGGPSIDDLLDRGTQLAADGPNCATAGVFAPLVAEIGAAMAGESLRILTGSGSPLVGTIRSWDARQGRVRELPLGTSSVLAATVASERQPASVAEPGLSQDQLSGDAPSAEHPDPRPDRPNLRAADQLIVDVRPAEHPDLVLEQPYLHLPLETIAAAVARADLSALPLDHDLVVACAQGPRARYAADLLAEAGAERVRTLSGGIASLAPFIRAQTQPKAAE